MPTPEPMKAARRCLRVMSSSPSVAATSESSASAPRIAVEVAARFGERRTGVVLAVQHGVGIEETEPAGEVAAVALQPLRQAVDHLGDHLRLLLGGELAAAAMSAGVGPGRAPPSIAAIRAVTSWMRMVSGGR